MKLVISPRALIVALLSLNCAAALTPLPDKAEESKRVRQVAIIGAGAAGSSAAYHLRKYAAEDGTPVNITIFEKTDRIGGRTLTVKPYDDDSLRVELGASIFVEINHILYDAVAEFNLSMKVPGPDEDGLMVIWDGERFVYEQDETSWDWWNTVKLFWKYGLAPYRAQQLMKTTVAKFLQLYEAPNFPFRSLTTSAYELNLTFVTAFTGEQFLANNNIDGLFSHDIVQASTRVNYASNLANIHGLDTMVSLAPSGAKQVVGGNWRIFDAMVKDSQAYVQFNTSVSHIGLESTDKPSKSPPKYVVKTKSAKHSAGETSEVSSESVAYDKVIFANPYQFSGIELDDGVSEMNIEEIPYVTLHVTLFTSPFQLSAGYFKLPDGSKPPSTVLTTLAADDDASSGLSGAGSAGFFSISTLKTVTNPKNGKLEYLYKIFSPDKVSATFLSSLLGVKVPESFTTTEPEHSSADGVEPISWYYPHVFHSYPKALPRVTFQDPILNDGLYYTSGIEGFISTMETSALMGKNVARLLADDLLEASTASKSETAGGSQKAKVVQDDGRQAVLAGRE